MSISYFLLICLVSFVFFVMGLMIGVLSNIVSKSKGESVLNINEMANSVKEGKYASFCIEVDKRESFDTDDLESMGDIFPELRRWEQN